MISVYLNSIRISDPDPHGARAVVIGESDTLVYMGSARGAVSALHEILVGQSVAVRHPGGLRSCMNKPALWAWVEGLGA